MTKDNRKAAPDASGGAKAAATSESTDVKHNCKAQVEQTCRSEKKERKEKQDKFNDT